MFPLEPIYPTMDGYSNKANAREKSLCTYYTKLSHGIAIVMRFVFSFFFCFFLSFNFFWAWKRLQGRRWQIEDWEKRAVWIHDVKFVENHSKLREKIKMVVVLKEEMSKRLKESQKKIDKTLERINKSLKTRKTEKNS